MDMTIEQVLMRSLKVSGDLTLDRNVSDSIVACWIFTTPGSLHVTEAVESFTGMTVWLNQHSPFYKYKELIFLSSGIVADDRVNCDSAEELGENAVRGIVGIYFANVTLKRKMHVFTLVAMGKTITIDKYPVVSLFDGVLCVGTKSKIILVIDKMCKISNKLPENPSYVLVGEDNLHRVHWPHPATYDKVCNAYFDYINRNYRRNVIVVSDG
ncbi:hypothetical protein PR048_013844 [Dryococelus australis]|uniref:Uncharacterized protein n=1 Tax=Dryococelus australis TaxID=614101 RepID=A0ABQ9HTA6_9NEOP|nr:hypothetical protein PR048_013844 [Dryococelus australis]